jgi:hypothetical protein
MRDVTTCTENHLLPALGAGILFTRVRLEYLPQCISQHISVYMWLLMQPHPRKIALLDRNQQEIAHYDAWH